MHHKDEEISINLSNSLKTNNPSESLHNHSKKETINNQNHFEPNVELQQLKDMIK